MLLMGTGLGKAKKKSLEFFWVHLAPKEYSTERGEAGVGGKAAPSLLMGTKRKQMEISRYNDVKR